MFENEVFSYRCFRNSQPSIPNDLYEVQIQEIAKNLRDNEREKLLKTHNTIMTLKNLSDHCGNEDLIDFWEKMGNKEQIEFLSNFIDHQYLYIYDRIEESYSIEELDAFKQKAADLETREIIKLIISSHTKDLNTYLAEAARKRKKKNPNTKRQKDFILDLVDKIIKERFLYENELSERKKYLERGIQVMHVNQEVRTNKIKKALPSTEDFISKSLNASVEITIETLQFYLYCTFYYFVEEEIFDKLRDHLPEVLDTYSRKDRGGMSEKLKSAWKSLYEKNEDNI